MNHNRSESENSPTALTEPFSKVLYIFGVVDILKYKARMGCRFMLKNQK
jgi:hypothetical protein